MPGSGLESEKHKGTPQKYPILRSFTLIIQGQGFIWKCMHFYTRPDAKAGDLCLKAEKK